jgi:hypothetical protein
MQMAEMPDAQIRDLENEDRIAVGLHGAKVADIGGDVADIDIIDHHVVIGRCAVEIPAAQHMPDALVRRQGEVRGMRLVHGHDVAGSATLPDHPL